MTRCFLLRNLPSVVLHSYNNIIHTLTEKILIIFISLWSGTCNVGPPLNRSEYIFLMSLLSEYLYLKYHSHLFREIIFMVDKSMNDLIHTIDYIRCSISFCNFNMVKVHVVETNLCQFLSTSSCNKFLCQKSFI